MDEIRKVPNTQQKPKKKGKHALEFHLNDEFKQVFIGEHTLFSVLGFTVGGILVGGTLEKMLHKSVGHLPTLIVGVILLLISGLVLKQFND